MLLVPLLSTALAAPPVLNLVPFGVGVYAHKKPLRGAVYSVTQAGGLATWYLATWPARYAVDTDDMVEYQRWQAVLVGAATLTVGSYIISVIDGAHLHDLEVEAAGTTAWNDPLPSVALRLPEPGAPAAALPTLSFAIASPSPGAAHDD